MRWLIWAYYTYRYLSQYNFIYIHVHVCAYWLLYAVLSPVSLTLVQFSRHAISQEQKDNVNDGKIVRHCCGEYAFHEHDPLTWWPTYWIMVAMLSHSYLNPTALWAKKWWIHCAWVVALSITYTRELRADTPMFSSPENYTDHQTILCFSELSWISFLTFLTSWIFFRNDNQSSWSWTV